MNMNYTSPLCHYLTKKNIDQGDLAQKSCFFIFRLGLLFPASSKCLIYYLCIIFTYVPWNFFLLFVYFTQKKKKKIANFSHFSVVLGMNDLRHV